MIFFNYRYLKVSHYERFVTMMTTSPASFDPVTYIIEANPGDAKLLHLDFWPHCINPWTTDLKEVHFYRFE